jgi:hypothetical protein
MKKPLLWLVISGVKQRHINRPVVSAELKYSAGDRDD